VEYGQQGGGIGATGHGHQYAVAPAKQSLALDHLADGFFDTRPV